MVCSRFGTSTVLIYGAPEVLFVQSQNLRRAYILSAAVGTALYHYLAIDLSVLSAVIMLFIASLLTIYPETQKRYYPRYWS